MSDGAWVARKKVVVMQEQTTMISPHRQLAQKGGKSKHMKIIAIIALAAVAFSFGACASKQASISTSTTASHGYSK